MTGFRFRRASGVQGGRSGAWRTLATLVALVSFGGAGCDREPAVAVIAVHATTEDMAYFATLTDSLAGGPQPIRIAPFPSLWGNQDSWGLTLAQAESISAIEGLVGVVGYHDSRSTLMVAPVFRAAGIPQVVPNATSRFISELGPTVFTLVPSDHEQGALLAEAAERGLGARRVSVFAVADEYGLGIRDGVLAALPSSVQVLDVVQYGLARNRCPVDLQPFVDASLLKGIPDVVILASRTPDAVCIMRLVHQRAPETRFLAADGVERKQVLLDAGEATGLAWFVRFWTPEDNPGLQTLERRYAAAGGSPFDAATPLRIDAVNLLAEAVREVGADPGRVVAWLHGLGVERPPFKGYAGDISFGPNARRPQILTDIDGNPFVWTPG